MDIIGSIVDLCHDIYLVYLELFRLDLSGNKGSYKYLSLISCLKEMINEEKELYELLARDIDSFNMLLNYVKSRPTQLFFLRMHGYMLFNEENDYIIGEDSCISHLIYSECNNNLYLLYLSFLHEYIDDDEYVSIRDGLIYTKYYNSFINLDLEEYLIANNFLINLIQDSLLVMDGKTDNNEMLECFKDAISVSMVGLLSIRDVDYSSQDRMVDIISSECMLRASLSLVGDRSDTLFNGMYRVLDELGNEENSTSVRIIRSIIEDRGKGRCRVKKIIQEGN